MLKEAEGICPGSCSPEEAYDREYRTYARAKSRELADWAF